MSPSGASFSAASSKSTSTFLSALVVSACVAGAQLLVFLVLRTSIKKVYSPRTYLPAPSKRAQPVSLAPWGWLLPTIRAPSLAMISTAGLDAYMYLRFLRMMVMIFGPASCLTAAVLLPLNAVGTSVSHLGLNSFAFGNIPQDRQFRYVGHLCCAYAVTIWVIFLVQKEMSNYIDLRQRYLTSRDHLQLPQSRTVLVTGVPKRFLSTEALKKLTANLPGGLRQVWISRELKQLPALYNDRLKCTAMLEAAETQLCKAAVKRNMKLTRRILSSGQHAGQRLNSTPELYEESSKGLDPVDRNPADELVHRKARPTHRLGFLGLFGRKVDTVDWCKDEVVRLTREIENERQKLDQHPPHNSAFIEFNDRLAAQIFSQIVLHQKPLRMAKRYVDAAPEDIIWDNLNINPYDERIRNVVSWVLTMGLVVLWSFPVAFIGSLSNITSLCTTTKELSWLCNTRSRLQDVIQGVPRISEIELILMTRHYIFLVIHGFVVTTLSSGLTAAIPALSKDAGQAVTILSVNLPKASIFFMTYMVTASLTGAGSSLLQVLDLIFYYLKLSVFASTPRSVYNICYTMSRPQFGTLFPHTTLLATLGLVYCIIAPIMSILAFFTFALHWLVYKYLFLFIFDIPAAHETGGRFFPLAMNHLFVGLYFSQLCLTGLFFLARDVEGDPSSVAQGALMVVLLFGTIFCHMLLVNSYAPLTMFVPLTMIEESSGLNEDGKVEAHGDEEQALTHRTSAERLRMNKNSCELDLEGTQAAMGTCSSRALPEAFKGPSRASTCPNLGPKNPRRDRSVRGPHLDSHDEIRESGSISHASNSPALVPHDRSTLSSISGTGVETFPEQGRTAFLHPAVWEKVRPIWVPCDPVGLASLEVADMRRRKIPASLVGSGITASGKVFVTRSPPEDAEVIEYQRGKVEGIFALPGAIGGVARAAGELIGGRVLQSTISTRRASGFRKKSRKSSVSSISRTELPGNCKNPFLTSINTKQGQIHGGPQGETPVMNELKNGEHGDKHEKSEEGETIILGGGIGVNEECVTEVEPRCLGHPAPDLTLETK